MLAETLVFPTLTLASKEKASRANPLMVNSPPDAEGQETYEQPIPLSNFAPPNKIYRW